MAEAAAGNAVMAGNGPRNAAMSKRAAQMSASRRRRSAESANGNAMAVPVELVLVMAVELAPVEIVAQLVTEQALESLELALLE